MSKQNYRAYFFQNMYLTGIQAGIQTQHCTAEMFDKYRVLEALYFDKQESEKQEALKTWAKEDKTTIILNGGMRADLVEIKMLLWSQDNPYAWSYFEESDEALGGCLTNVGIILPEVIWNAPRSNTEEFVFYSLEKKLTSFEADLIDTLQSKRLMN